MDEEKNSDDMMSRRMRSGTESSAASSDPKPSTFEEKAPEASEDTVAFEAFPAVRPQSSQRTEALSTVGTPPPAATAVGSGKPSVLSEEEWAAINGGAIAEPAAQPAASRPAAAGQKHRRYGFLDVIASIWVALATPFVLFALAVRAVASGLFLKFEYFYRPGFPADSYGFSQDDRLHFGSYTVDYLTNLDDKRYLADIVQADGTRLFTEAEVSHMADVKALISLLYLVAIIGVIGAIIAGLYLARKRGPGMQAGLRWGASVTLLLILAVVAIAVTGFDRFFRGFHEVFFTGNWEFYVDDSLIRLFPETFWMDAGIAGGAIIILVALVLLAISFIGHSKRRAAKSRSRKAATGKATAAA